MHLRQWNKWNLPVSIIILQENCLTRIGPNVLIVWFYIYIYIYIYLDIYIYLFIYSDNFEAISLNVDVHHRCNDAQESHEAAADEREARCSVFTDSGEIDAVAVVGPGTAFQAKLTTENYWLSRTSRCIMPVLIQLIPCSNL